MKAVPPTILYLGSNSPASNSRHRADGLRRLGCEVTVVDPEDLIGPRRRWQAFVDYHTGYVFLQRLLLRELKAKFCVLANSPDLIWINGGELLGPNIAKFLRLSFDCKIILYQNDDPTGPREWKRFYSLRAAFPFYDVCVCCREHNLLELLAFGAKRVVRIFMSYDEVVHAPQKSTDDVARLESDTVLFIGTFISGEHRDDFLLQLKQAGLPIHVRGNRWQRSPHWFELSQFHKGNGIVRSDYARAIAKASICLGFLSHGNRDLHTRRSVEVPFAGSLICAERTSEHQLLYEEGFEAVFWDSAEECSLICRDLLAHPLKREWIRLAGSSRVRELGVGNEDISRNILNAI